jgi:integrase/recombinase XerD
MEIQTIKDWLNRMSDEIRLKRYSGETLDCYLSFLKKFLIYFPKKADPSHINISEIKQFLLLFEKHPAQYKQLLATLRFFYTNVIHQPEKLKGIRYINWEPKLPTIIEKEVLIERIFAIKNERYRVFFALLYSTGLRVAEGCCLRIADFNKERRTIIVRMGKGGKDRIVPYPKVLGEMLNKYHADYHTKESIWLFEGTNPQNYISKSTVQRLSQTYLQTNCHNLRHCYSVHMLEEGLSIYKLKEILGHKNIHTTEIYLRCMNPNYSIAQDLLSDVRIVATNSNIIPFRPTGTSS